MSTVDQALETQLANIQKKTGRTLAELGALLQASGLTKHGQLRDMFKQSLGLGHGDANTLVHALLQSDGERAAKAAGKSDVDVLGEIYAGSKAHLRPIHDRLMDAINGFGEFETAPKKGYVSLRRAKQFAMIGPATQKRVDLGLNFRAGADPVDGRLKVQPKGAMCSHVVELTDAADVDESLIALVRLAYAAS